MTTAAQTGLSENAAGAISYVTFLPAVVFLVLPPYNASPYIRFHAWQSICLNVTAFVVNIGLSMVTAATLFMGPQSLYLALRLIWLAWFVIWVLCVVQALNGKRFKLPLLGSLAEKMAGQ